MNRRPPDAPRSPTVPPAQATEPTGRSLAAPGKTGSVEPRTKGIGRSRGSSRSAGYAKVPIGCIRGIIPIYRAHQGLDSDSLAKAGLDMRLLMLLLVLGILGAMVFQRLHVTAPQGAAVSGTSTPKVPTRPQDFKAFEQDINRFVEEAARQRADEIDKASR